MRSKISAAVAAAETEGTHALELSRLEISSQAVAGQHRSIESNTLRSDSHLRPHSRIALLADSFLEAKSVIS